MNVSRMPRWIRPARRSLSLLLLIAWGHLPAAGFAVLHAQAPDPVAGTPARYARAVAIAEAGWVRVTLDVGTQSHLAPDGRDLRVRAPDGSEVPFAIRDPEPAAPPVEGRVVGVAAEAAGWWVVVDAGERPARHSGITFEFANRVAAPGVRLEASDDGADWRPAASGDLFRLGEAEGLWQNTLRYADSDARYLRLWWPAVAGYPSVRRIAILPAARTPAPAATVPFAPVEAERAPGGVAYRLSLPGPGLALQRVDLAWRGAGIVGFRLLQPADGRWHVLAEGTLAQPAAGRPPPAIPLSGAPLGSPELRLELAGGGTASIELVSAAGVVPPRWVVFYAPAAGAYALEYGALGVAPGVALPAPPPAPLDRIPEGAAGPERERPWSELPASSVTMGGPMPGANFAARWPVMVDMAAEPMPPGPAAAAGGGPTQAAGEAAEAGTSPAASDAIVRLDLPEDVYVAARADLADVRLAFGPADGGKERQAPFVHWSPPAPVLALEMADLVPETNATRRASGVQIDLPAPPLPYTLLELSTPAAVFDRVLEVAVIGDARLGTDAARQVVSTTRWHCPGAAALPCRLALDVDGRAWIRRDAGAPRRLEITFLDGDNAPLPRVGVKLWRRADTLVFVWPGEGRVELVAGAPDLGRPRYDLAAIEAELLARPARAARLDVASGPDPRGGVIGLTEGQSRWLLIGALGLAAAALAAVLARVVRSAPSGGTRRHAIRDIEDEEAP